MPRSRPSSIINIHEAGSHHQDGRKRQPDRVQAPEDGADEQGRADASPTMGRYVVTSAKSYRSVSDARPSMRRGMEVSCGVQIEIVGVFITVDDALCLMLPM